MYDLTTLVDENAARWPGQPKVCLEDALDTVRDGARASIVRMSLHTGTHLDAPCHFPSSDTRTVAELPIELLCGDGVLIDLPGVEDFQVLSADLIASELEQIQPKDRVILRTGWHRYGLSDGPEYDIERYMLRYPGLSKDAVDALLERAPSWVATDTPSPDHPFSLSGTIGTHRPDVLPATMIEQIDRRRFPRQYAHRTLLAAGVPMIEHLGCDVGRVPAGRIRVWALPIKIASDGAQVRVVCEPQAPRRGTRDECSN